MDEGNQSGGGLHGSPPLPPCVMVTAAVGVLGVVIPSITAPGVSAAVTVIVEFWSR